MQLFFAPDLKDEFYNLNEEETFHCTRVLRLKERDYIHLTDGKGNLFEAYLENTDKKGALLKIVNSISEYGKRNYHLHIAIAPTKNIDRFEWFLEKATEIGIDEISPIICEHSERTVIKPERLEKIIVAAMKQSIKTYKPKLNPQEYITNFLNHNFNNFQTFIATCEGDSRQMLKQVYENSKNVLILIGPEGDFSADEIQKSINAGFEPVSLGESRLRTETAGLVACHTINLINEKK
jgi:16S rRNA (uracil1498-N3)-methyltransferase